MEKQTEGCHLKGYLDVSVAFPFWLHNKESLCWHFSGGRSRRAAERIFGEVKQKEKNAAALKTVVLSSEEQAQNWRRRSDAVLTSTGA